MRLWSFPVLGGFACLSVWFGRIIGLYEVIQYTHTHTHEAVMILALSPGPRHSSVLRFAVCDGSQ